MPNRTLYELHHDRRHRGPRIAEVVIDRDAWDNAGRTLNTKTDEGRVLSDVLWELGMNGRRELFLARRDAVKQWHRVLQADYSHAAYRYLVESRNRLPSDPVRKDAKHQRRLALRRLRAFEKRENLNPSST